MPYRFEAGPPWRGSRLAAAWLVMACTLAAGCDLFQTRTPEPPVDASGTYVQPDTPDQVIANIRAAVAELNTQNYRRSLADAFTFEPSVTAEARDPSLWTTWGRAEEEQYFGTLVAAAQHTTGNELRLESQTLSVVNETRFVLDATYVLTINHRRPDLSVTLEGRLVWVLEQGADGLWYLLEWTDHAVGSAATWSDLKAEFIR